MKIKHFCFKNNKRYAIFNLKNKFQMVLCAQLTLTSTRVIYIIYMKIVSVVKTLSMNNNISDTQRDSVAELKILLFSHMSDRLLPKLLYF